MPAVQDDSQRNRRTAKRILAIGLPLVVIAGTGIGYAFWTGGGSGTGSATSANGVANLAFSDNAPSGLAPGVTTPAGITVTVTNNGSSSVHLAQVVAAKTTVTQTLAGAAAGPCGIADYTLSNPIMAPAGGVDIAPGAFATFSGASLLFNNTTSNQDGCKSATLNLSYTAS